MDDDKFYLGIDLGSTTVKYVLLNSRGRALQQEYVRHQSAVFPTLLDCLKRLNAKFNLNQVCVNFTGSAALALAEYLECGFVQEVIAASTFLKRLPGGVDTSIELGGEDSKILFLSGGMELRMNEACAGGTGAFIDQMATLLNTDALGLNELASRYQKIYPMASRCGVFAKTDLVALLNQGAAKEDIAKSIFEAVCEQTISGLACGRNIEGRVCFLGGPLSFLSELRQSFIDRLSSDKTTFLELDDAQYAMACGAALQAIKDEQDQFATTKQAPQDLSQIIDKLSKANFKPEAGTLPALFKSPGELQEFKDRHAREKLNSAPLSQAQGNLFLGIDLGSTTVKSVLLDEKLQLLDSFYASNEGSPLEKLLPKVKELLAAIPQGAQLCAICTTGYGASLAKAALNAQYSEVETLAHQKAACAFDPDTTYVIDIGGQDMKCIKVKNGIIKDMQLNEACSSGCGSFIETFARQLNLSLSDFVAAAQQAIAPSDLGTRCSVFMNSKVKQAQRDNVPLPDIAAGLCFSIVRNALYKVLRIHDSSELGDHVVVQGGTFLNDAVLRAFELLTGHNVIRPNIAGLMGAFGAALIAKERWQSDRIALVLQEDFFDLSKIKIRQFRCKGCSNHCLLTMNTFLSGQKHIHGNRCDFALKTGIKNKERNEFIEFKLATLFEREVLPADQAPRGSVGIPRVLNIYEHYPYWHALFTALGMHVELSPLTTKDIAELGNITIPSQSLCYPAKLTHGHVSYLAAQGIKDIFLPCIPREAKVDKAMADSYACPVVGGYPEALKLNVITQYPGLKIHTPFLDISKRATVLRALKECFPQLPPREIKQAIAKAQQALAAYRNALEAEGERLVKKAEDEGKTLIVLSGRPYHIDPLINHGIPSLISSMGTIVVTEDAVFQLAKHRPKLDVVNQWAFHSRLYKAAEFAAENPNVQMVQLVSFGCGIDAITSEQVRKILERHDKIYTLLKIDEGDTLGAAKIRIKSLLTAVNANALSHLSGESLHQQKQDKGVPNELRTLYVPQMAPIHFPILTSALQALGYKVQLLPEVNDKAIELGLKYVNNDACYPAIVVIGQLIEALVSNKIDAERAALLLAQTCGPCRATNYPALLRWALHDLGYDKVPIVTLSSYDLDTDALHLKLGLHGLYRLMKGILLGDLLQKLYFHTKTYEVQKGSSDKVLQAMVEKCSAYMLSSQRHHNYVKIIRAIVAAFSEIKLQEVQNKPKVGIVGEILLKYHPKANLDLMNTLIEEGAEPVIGDISSFLLYCLNDSIFQAKYMKGSWVRATGSWIISHRFNHMRNVISRALEQSKFESLTPFNDYKQAIEGLVSVGQQAGEGWLLTAEMIDYIEHGVNNVLCVQPFACLPNHVTGKGVMRAIRMGYENANLCSIDFEAGTSQSNVSNRLKLFLSQAKEIQQRQEEGRALAFKAV